jgi:hypothetical protein
VKEINSFLDENLISSYFICVYDIFVNILSKADSNFAEHSLSGNHNRRSNPRFRNLSSQFLEISSQFPVSKLMILYHFDLFDPFNPPAKTFKPFCSKSSLYLLLFVYYFKSEVSAWCEDSK